MTCREDVLSLVFEHFADEARLVTALGSQFGLMELSPRLDPALKTRETALRFSNPRVSDLAACVRVCRRWFDLATPSLWSLADPWLVRRDVEALLGPVTSLERRKLYASFIRSCSLRLSALARAGATDDLQRDSGQSCDVDASCSALAGATVPGPSCDRERPGGTVVTRQLAEPPTIGLTFPRLRGVVIDLDETTDQHPDFAPAKLLQLLAKPDAQVLEGISGNGSGDGGAGRASLRDDGRSQAAMQHAGQRATGAGAGVAEPERDRPTSTARITSTTGSLPTSAGFRGSDTHQSDEGAAISRCGGDGLADNPSSSLSQSQTEEAASNRTGAIEHRDGNNAQTGSSAAPAVRELLIRVKTSNGFGLSGNQMIPQREAMEALAEVIPTVFPHLRCMWLERPSTLHPEAVQRLITRLPRLRCLNIADMDYIPVDIGN
ncbi:hypothetical protein KEM52_001741 [Ascosphaera acerosa]|nr:hypothetical protein KEM52_001741 [Ascosphaera acerosa]